MMMNCPCAGVCENCNSEVNEQLDHNYITRECTWKLLLVNANVYISITSLIRAIHLACKFHFYVLPLIMSCIMDDIAQH